MDDAPFFDTTTTTTQATASLFSIFRRPKYSNKPLSQGGREGQNTLIEHRQNAARGFTATLKGT